MNVSTLNQNDTVLIAEDISVPNFVTGDDYPSEHLRRIQGMIFNAESHAERLELVLGQIDTFDAGTPKGISDTLNQWKTILEIEVKKMDSPSTDTAIESMKADLKKLMTTSTTTIEDDGSEPEQQDYEYISTAQFAQAEIGRCGALSDHCKTQLDKNLSQMENLKTDNITLEGLIKGYGMMVKEAGGSKSKTTKQGAK